MSNGVVDVNSLIKAKPKTVDVNSLIKKKDTATPATTSTDGSVTKSVTPSSKSAIPSNLKDLAAPPVAVEDVNKPFKDYQVPSPTETFESATGEDENVSIRHPHPYYVNGQQVTREELRDKLFEPQFVEQLQQGTVKLELPEDDPDTKALVTRQQQSGTRLGDKFDYLMSGLNDVAAGVVGMPNYVANIAREIGVDVPMDVWEIESKYGSKLLKKSAQEYIEQTRQYEDGFVGALSKGDMVGAADQAFNTVVQSAPVSISVALTGAALGPPAALGTMAGIVASGEYATSDEYEGLTNAERLVRSSVFGVAEAAGEMVTGGILTKNFNVFKSGLRSIVYKTAVKQGKEVAQELATELAKKQAKEIFKEYGIDIAKEGGSELFTEMVQMGTDDIMGVQDYELKDYLNNGIEATMLGAVSGGIMGTPTAAKGVKRFVDEKLSQGKGEDLKQAVDKKVASGTIKPEAGEKIKENIDTRTAVVNSVPQDAPNREELVDLIAQKAELEKQVAESKAPPQATEAKIEALDREYNEKTGAPLTEKEQKELEKLEAKKEEKPAEGEKKKELTESEQATLDHFEKRKQKAKDLLKKKPTLEVAAEVTKPVVEKPKTLNEKQQELVNELPKQKVSYKDLNGIGDLSVYLNNPEALNAPHLKSAKAIYEDIKAGKPIKDTPSVNEKMEVMDGQNRIAAQLAAGITDVDVAVIDKSFYDKQNQPIQDEKAKTPEAEVLTETPLKKEAEIVQEEPAKAKTGTQEFQDTMDEIYSEISKEESAKETDKDKQARFKAELLKRGLPEQGAEGSSKLLVKALTDKNTALGVLDMANKNLRELWSKETGMDLPKSQKGTRQVIEEYFKNPEEAKNITDAAKGALALYDGDVLKLANGDQNYIYENVPEATPEIAQQIIDAAREKVKQGGGEKMLKTEKPQPEKKSIADIKAEQALNQRFNYGKEGLMTRKEFMDKKLAEGATVEVKEVVATGNTAKLEQELEFLKRNAPFGNENHPQTKRYREVKKILDEGGIKKPEYKLREKSGGSWTITKTEYDYAQKTPSPTSQAKGLTVEEGTKVKPEPKTTKQQVAQGEAKTPQTLSDTQKKHFDYYVDELGNLGNYSKSFLEEFKKKSDAYDKLEYAAQMVDTREGVARDNNTELSSAEKKKNDNIKARKNAAQRDFSNWIDENKQKEGEAKETKIAKEETKIEKVIEKSVELKEEVPLKEQKKNLLQQMDEAIALIKGEDGSMPKDGEEVTNAVKLLKKNGFDAHGGNVRFEIKGDGTFSLALDTLDVSRDMAAKEFPASDMKPKATSMPSPKRAGKSQYREIALSRGSLEENQRQLDYANENLAEAKKRGNQKQVELFTEEQKRQQDIYDEAAKIDYKEEAERVIQERKDSEAQRIDKNTYKKGKNLVYEDLEGNKYVATPTKGGYDITVNGKEMTIGAKKESDVKGVFTEIATTRIDLPTAYEKPDITPNERIQRGKDKLKKIATGKTGKAYDITGLTAEVLDALYDVARGYAQKGIKEGFDGLKAFIKFIKEETESDLTEKDITDIYEKANPKEKTKPESKEPAEEDEESPKRKKRAFMKRVEADEKISPEVKELITDPDRLYDVASNQESNRLADELLSAYERNDGYDVLFEKLQDMNSGMNEAVRSMLASKLANRLAKDGRMQESKDVYAWMAKVGTGAGQFNQALRSDTHPEAVAALKIIELEKLKSEKLGEKQPNGKTPQEEIDKIRSEMEELMKEEVGKLNERIKKLEADIAAEKTKPKAEPKIYGRTRIAKGLHDLKKALGEPTPGLSIAPKIPSVTKALVEIGQGLIEESKATVDNVLQKIEEYLDKNLKGKINFGDYREAVHEDLVKSMTEKEKVSDIVNEHYSKWDESAATLAEKLATRAGLSEKEADALADKIEKQLKEKIKAKAEQILAKSLGTSKIPLLNRKNKSITEKIIADLSKGALNEKLFADLFAEKYGFVALDAATMKELAKFSYSLSLYPEGSAMLHRRMQEFNDFLDSITNDPYKKKFLTNLANEMFYTNILGEFSPPARSIKGSTMSGAAELLWSSLLNPRLLFSGEGIKALGRGTNLNAIKEMMRTGYNPFEKNPESRTGVLQKLINTPFKDLSKAQIPAKIFYYLPVKFLRALYATDALVRYPMKEYFSTVSEYNKLITEGMNPKDKAFWNKMNDRLKNNEADRLQAERQAEQEITELRSKGEKIADTFFKQRADEIIEQQRARDTREYSDQRSAKSVLAHTPEGMLGWAYMFALKGTQDITILNRLIPFLKIPTNAANMWLDWSPYGFKRAALGKGAPFIMSENVQKQTRSGRDNLTPEERSEQLVKAAIGTMVFATLTQGLVASLNDDEDDDWIQISFDGYGDYSANEGLRKSGWKEYSFRLKNPVTGEFTDWYYYRDSPLALAFANMGYVHDKVKYQGESFEENAGSLMAQGMLQSLLFIKEQTYVKSLMDFSQIFQRQGDIPKTLGNFTSQQTQAQVYPSLYKRAYTTYKGLENIPNRRPIPFKEDMTLGFVQRVVKNVPYLEDYKTGEAFDALGYPVSYRFEDTPGMPDFVLETAQDILSEKKLYPAWDIINEKGVEIAFADPRRYDGKEISYDDRMKIQRQVANGLQRYVLDNYDEFKELSKSELQEKIDDKRESLVNEAKRTVINKIDLSKPMTPEQRNQLRKEAIEKSKQLREEYKKKNQ